MEKNYKIGEQKQNILMVFSSAYFFIMHSHFGELLQSLKKRCNLNIASVDPNHDFDSSLQDVNFTEIGFGKLTNYRKICYLFLPLIVLKTYFLVIRRNISTVVVFSGGYPQLVAHLTGLLSHKPVVIYLRVDHKKIREINFVDSLSVSIWDFLVTWSLKRATHIITLSNFLTERAIAWGITKNKVTLIPFGVDTNTFKPLEIDEKYPNSVVFVGRWSKEKGVDLLMQIADRLRNVNFILVGAEGNKINQDLPNLYPMGFVPHKDVAKYIALGKILISTSMTEGQPMGCLEALACGKPVIANRTRGLSELIIPEVGWLFDGNQIESAINVINKALKDSSILHEKGKMAREYAMTFSWDSHAQRLLDLLN
jgi:glycosyltransferase involved in cell wall biosynthesis